MSREIKFRAWDGEQMVSPDYIDRKGRGHWKSDSVPICTGVNAPDALMQFTGLHDAEGKEIYEGDILETLDGKLAIEWNDDVCIFQYSDGHCFIDRYGMWCVVVGNIYENPELLNAPDQKTS